MAYAAKRIEGKLAFLFPGEGSQYPAMFADLAVCFDVMQDWLDFWHGLYELPVGHTRTDIVFPSCEIDAERRKLLEHRLHDMDVGSESVFIGGMAMYELLRWLGVDADVMLGHSSGESAALGATGANPAVTPADRADCIRQHFAAYEALLAAGKIPTGALLAVGALPPATVEAHVAAVPGVVVAMDNCSNQMVLYGSREGIAAVHKSLADEGGICLMLPFDRGYHTPAFADASAAFLAYYKNVRLGVPKVPLYSCASADLFPANASAVRKLAAAQWSQKVRFRETVLKMHEDGVRLFVEVGPSSNLTAFVNDILIEREFVALPTNVRRKSGVEQFLNALAQLYVAGRGVDIERLFAGRAVVPVDFDGVPPAPRGVRLDNTMPMVRLSAEERAFIQRLAGAPPSANRHSSDPRSADLRSEDLRLADPRSDPHSGNPPIAHPLASTVTASPLPPSADAIAAPFPVPAPSPVSYTTPTVFEPDSSTTAPAQGFDASEEGGASAPLDGRERVMADYFGLMRGFLDQQRSLIEGWAMRPLQSDDHGLASETIPTSAPDRAADAIATTPCAGMPDTQALFPDALHPNAPRTDAPVIGMPSAGGGVDDGFSLSDPRTSALTTWASTHVRPGCVPLLDELVEHDEKHVTARCSVSLLNDNFVRDHVLSGPVSATDPELFGLSCVPFSVSLEVMAEACALLAGRADVRVIENVKAYDWVSLDAGALTFEVRADVIDLASGHYAARIVTARGPVLTAEFRFEASPQIGAMAPLAEPHESCLNAPYLYATGMFHGPVFQSMTYVEAWDPTGIDVQLSPCSLAHFFAEGQVAQLVLNPVLLDAMGQVVACWLVQYVGTEFHAFPSTIERIELAEACPVDRAGLVMRMRQRPADGVSTDIAAPRVWQFDCVDGNGNVVMRGRDLVNLFFRVPTAYHEVRVDPLNGWLGRPLPLLQETGAALWEVPLLSEEFCAQSGAICLRVLAHALLGPIEREEWHALQGHLRRKREWLFGRAALKEVVRAWVHEQTGLLLHPTDIVVRHDALGAPLVDGDWCETLVEAPHVSLTHKGGICLAAVTPPDRPVGVDIEELGRIRAPHAMADASAPEEAVLVRGLQGEPLDERLLRLWCAKEAAAKCLGTGLQGRPHAFVVTTADAAYENLQVRHETSLVDIRVTRCEQTIIAVAWQETVALAVTG